MFGLQTSSYLFVKWLTVTSTAMQIMRNPSKDSKNEKTRRKMTAKY